MADDTQYEKVWLPRESAQRARNTVAALKRRGISWMTMVSIVRTGIAQLEKEFNDGEPFPVHDGCLPAGRPPKKPPE